MCKYRTVSPSKVQKHGPVRIGPKLQVTKRGFQQRHTVDLSFWGVIWGTYYTNCVAIEDTNKSGPRGDKKSWKLLDRHEKKSTKRIWNQDKTELKRTKNTSMLSKKWSQDCMYDSPLPCATAQTVTVILSVKALPALLSPRQTSGPFIFAALKIKLFQMWKERQIPMSSG